MGLIKAWSPSRLADFEVCAYRAKLKIIDKVPEPDRPLPAGKTEHANDRGTRIHTECENYVRGKGNLPVESLSFKDELASLKESFKTGSVSLEGEWAFDINWQPVDWRSAEAWLRLKIDALKTMSRTRACVIDHKSGRKFGNEIKHGEQMQIYAIATACRMPELEEIDVELWYHDQNELTHQKQSAKKWLYMRKAYHNRGLKMTTATEFKPNPSKYACQWCPYRDGICKFAYKDVPVRRKGEPV